MNNINNINNININNININNIDMDNTDINNIDMDNTDMDSININTEKINTETINSINTEGINSKDELYNICDIYDTDYTDEPFYIGETDDDSSYISSEESDESDDLYCSYYTYNNFYKDNKKKSQSTKNSKQDNKLNIIEDNIQDSTLETDNNIELYKNYSNYRRNVYKNIYNFFGSGIFTFSTLSLVIVCGIIILL